MTLSRRSGTTDRLGPALADCKPMPIALLLSHSTYGREPLKLRLIINFGLEFRPDPAGIELIVMIYLSKELEQFIQDAVSMGLYAGG